MRHQVRPTNGGFFVLVSPLARLGLIPMILLAIRFGCYPIPEKKTKPTFSAPFFRHTVWVELSVFISCEVLSDACW